MNFFKLVVCTFLALLVSGSVVVEGNAPTTINIDLPPYTEAPNRALGITWDEADVVCLAENIYHEARSEPIEGQYAVADVVIYRTLNANFPNTICEVVAEPLYHDKSQPIKYMCQFSWRCTGIDTTIYDRQSFNRALYIAKDILNDPMYPGIIGYALNYHAYYVDPQWEGLEPVEVVGNHIFYL